MKLSKFITTRLEPILAEWEAFARTQQPEGSNMSALALRDHAKQILRAIALDIDTDQTAGEQQRKSEGLAVTDAGTGETAAATHGTLRQVSGFSLVQLNAEFRALRATVLRLWLPHVRELDESSTRDMIRFNETIDQALAESIVTYTEKAERSRDTFLAILGHDLRSPLQTMGMAGDFLAQRIGEPEVRDIGARVRRSAAAMTAMVNDLLEYARSQLGSDLPVRREPADLSEVCRWAIADASVAHPECNFELSVDGPLPGQFDAVRMQQLLSNLLNNAVQYRGPGEPVSLSAEGMEESFVLKVHNTGSTIPPASLNAIFNPLVQLAVTPDQQGRPNTSMGLGLFIAREIATGHGGSIHATSSPEDGTVFTVTLPRGAERPVSRS